MEETKMAIRVQRGSGFEGGRRFALNTASSRLCFRLRALLAGFSILSLVPGVSLAKDHCLLFAELAGSGFAGLIFTLKQLIGRSLSMSFNKSVTRPIAGLSFSLMFLLASAARVMAASTAPKASPTKINFGKEVFGVTGETSKAKTVSISNPKNGQSITGLSFQITGANPGNFFSSSVIPPLSSTFTPASSVSICGTTLSANSKCAVTVTFSPTGLGDRSASLVITDSAGSVASIDLSGTGEAGKIKIKPTSLSFGKVQVDTVSSTRTVTLTNPNTVALGITSIGQSGPFAITGTSCSSSLAASSDCQVSVTYNPISASNPGEPSRAEA